MTKFPLFLVGALALAGCGTGHDDTATRSYGGGGNTVINQNPCGSGCAQDLTPDGNVGGNISGGQVTTSAGETSPASDDDTSTPPSPVWG